MGAEGRAALTPSRGGARGESGPVPRGSEVNPAQSGARGLLPWRSVQVLCASLVVKLGCAQSMHTGAAEVSAVTGMSWTLVRRCVRC